MKSLKLLGAASVAALSLSATSAHAATTLNWLPQSTDATTSDFDVATQTFSAVAASNISFAGNGYFHNHGLTSIGFSISAEVNGAWQTVYAYNPAASVDYYYLSGLGTLNFTGGNVTAIRIQSTSYVGNAFHSFSGETFTLDGNVTAVPEPASWAMMIGGFALLGGAMRRRSTALSFA